VAQSSIYWSRNGIGHPLDLTLDHLSPHLVALLADYGQVLVTSSIKPEVHISLSSEEDRSTATGSKRRKSCIQFGHVIFEIRSRTDRQTDTLIAILSDSSQTFNTRTHTYLLRYRPKPNGYHSPLIICDNLTRAACLTRALYVLPMSFLHFFLIFTF